jgi:hypothetical protein
MKTRTILLLTIIAAAPAAVLAQATPPMPVPPDHALSSLESAARALGPHFSWLVPLSAWLGAAGLVSKTFAASLERWLADRLAWDVDTYGSDHDQYVRSILSAKTYRWLAFSLDFLLRLKLPSVASYDKMLAAQGTNAAPPAPVVPPATGPAPTPENWVKAPFKAPVAALLLACSLLLAGCGTTLDPTGWYGSGAALNTNTTSLATNLVPVVSTNLDTGAVSTNLAPRIVVVTNLAAVADALVLFEADKLVGTSYNAMKDFSDWEAENRAALWSVSHEVKHTADEVRKHGKDWISSLIVTRDAYHDNPTLATRSSLQTSMAVIAAALGEARKYAQTSNVGAAPASLRQVN